MDTTNPAQAAAMVFFGLAIWACIFALYWLPTIVAFRKQRPSKGAIAALNFFLGWTLIGWVIALCWSLSATAQPPAIYITNPPA